jgi:biotin-(acetyl-CoA carboxylase) ligase
MTNHLYKFESLVIEESLTSTIFTGRAGNKWESPNGCLMFSFTLTMDNGRLLPFLQYVVSLALLDAIEHISLEKVMRFPDNTENNNIDR